MPHAILSVEAPGTAPPAVRGRTEAAGQKSDEGGAGSLFSRLLGSGPEEPGADNPTIAGIGDLELTGEPGALAAGVASPDEGPFPAEIGPGEAGFPASDDVGAFPGSAGQGEPGSEPTSEASVSDQPVDGQPETPANSDHAAVNEVLGDGTQADATAADEASPGGDAVQRSEEQLAEAMNGGLPVGEAEPAAASLPGPEDIAGSGPADAGETDTASVTRNDQPDALQGASPDTDEGRQLATAGAAVAGQVSRPATGQTDTATGTAASAERPTPGGPAIADPESGYTPNAQSRGTGGAAGDAGAPQTGRGGSADASANPSGFAQTLGTELEERSGLRTGLSKASPEPTVFASPTETDGPVVRASSPAQSGAGSTPVLPMRTIAIHMATRLSSGQRQFEIRLDPPELGRIDVRMEIARDGQVSAQLTADRPETLDALQRDQRALERALQTAGLDVDSGALKFSLRGDGQERRPGDAQAGSEGQGEAGSEGDTDEEGVERRIVSLSAVDIRV